MESTLAPGLNALKTYDPPISMLEGRRVEGVRRRGKLFLIDMEGELTLLIHLMSAGRLQLFEGRASLRDRTSRFLVRLTDGRELRRASDCVTVAQRLLGLAEPAARIGQCQRRAASR